MLTYKFLSPSASKAYTSRTMSGENIGTGIAFIRPFGKFKVFNKPIIT